MPNPFDTPLDQLAASAWARVSSNYRSAFFVVVFVNVLAFGFEMTNLTIHHDDVGQILVDSYMLQMDLGRFGFGWLHYYLQASHVMPFLQMAEGILYMSLYGVVTAHLWGARRTADIALTGAILSVFPYVAQIFQYNTVMAQYPLAHLLAALAVLFSVRATIVGVLVSALLYCLAFSIYQSVVANAATIFLIWFVTSVAFPPGGISPSWRALFGKLGCAVAAVGLGAAIYVSAIFALGIQLASYQGVDQALSGKETIDVALALKEVLAGTRSSWIWPENYLPGGLKKLQLLLLAGAGLCCLVAPKTWLARMAAGAALILAAFSPRTLQMIHPQGWYHNLSLTAYAVTIAGAFLMLVRTAGVAARNASLALATVLVGGYVVNCNWISTVNHLNTMAHYATMTQILARVRSVPDADWDGKSIVVVGTYDMRTDYPYKRTTGVASDYIDAHHLGNLAHLMCDDAKIVAIEAAPPEIAAFAATLPAWPHPRSVGVIGGTGVVVLSQGPEPAIH